MDKLLWLSVLPPLITIALAIWTKRIIPSLFVGLIVGSMLQAKAFFGGFTTAVDYVLNMLSDKGNLAVLLFLYLFSGLVALMRKSGGIKAFTQKAESFIRGKHAVFYTLWGLLPFTFIDCGFRVVAAGSITRPLTKKYEIAKERLAFMLNNTASPVVELVPIATTFVGYNIGVISQSMNTAGIEGESAYSILLRSIPLQFFSIVIIPITFLSIYFNWTKGSEDTKETEKPKEESKEHKGTGMNMQMEEDQLHLKPRMINLILPLLLIIGLSIGLFWIIGKQNAGAGASIQSIITSAEPAKTMLLALFVSIIITAELYLFQGYKLKAMSSDIISGGNEIMKTIAILILAWPLSTLSEDLGLSELIKNTFGNSIPGSFVPVSVFFTTCAVTYFIGSSWGAISLLMPLSVVLAHSTGAGIPLTVAAVITGATFGDVTSPVSGMANMSSNIARAEHMKYIKYASPYNFTAAGISAVLFVVAAFILKN